MKDALIGYTGFVGSNLVQQREFQALYNSKNFKEMADSEFGTMVCAGVSAVKWKANKEPELDWSGIEALQSVLQSVSAERFILISTIDVYPVVIGKDESFDCHGQSNHPYGTHRLRFEDFCRDKFPNCTIVRLPGLFGDGIKKNVIFDMLNGNCLDAINPACSFQYYPLRRLWQDIETAMSANLPLVNFFTEPIKTAEMHSKFFPEVQIGAEPAGEAHYDLQTTHAKHWGKEGAYMLSKDEVLEELGSFVEGYRK